MAYTTEDLEKLNDSELARTALREAIKTTLIHPMDTSTSKIVLTDKNLVEACTLLWNLAEEDRG